MKTPTTAITIIAALGFLQLGEARSWPRAAACSALGWCNEPALEKKLVFDKRQAGPSEGQGDWKVVGATGVCAMHFVLTAPTKILIIDKAEKNVALTATKDFAHSVEYDIETNTYRVLDLKTNTFCSAGAFLPNGTLVETGGAEQITNTGALSEAGFQSIRLFDSCSDGKCDWLEFPNGLNSARWYNTMTALPDGRIFILGGSKVSTGVNDANINNPTYEFYPPGDKKGQFPFPFLNETLPYNLYPFVHVIPGPATQTQIFIFANTKSIIWDWKAEKITYTYPVVPGPSRSYPLTGTGLLLPLSYENNYTPEFLVCGGGKSLATAGIFEAADDTCGRIQLSAANPTWEMDTFVMPRVMSDNVILADGKVLFLNGAGRGVAGYDKGNPPFTYHQASDPVLTPILYDPAAPLGKRWSRLKPTDIPRMYHSVATLVPDGRVFVAGSNPNENWRADGDFPSEYRAEMFTPPYLLGNTSPRLTVTAFPPTIGYGASISLTVTLPAGSPAPKVTAALIHYGFVTHSQHMGQRYVKLEVASTTAASTADTYTVTIKTPPHSVIMPPGKHYLHLLNNGTPAMKAVQVSLA